ncbi:MAG TPA: protein kinase, partial [Vicinamibacterales bacterium]|nr:protein kinase [Vicinamibacterales bacterium]
AINGAPCLVSELLEGRTLRARLNAGLVSPFEALGYAEQIIGGLMAAHEKNIVHRDLKPENVFITAEGRLKILDFGLAKQLHHDARAATTAPAPLTTAAGAVLGTVGYTSPEQARGEVVDARSDLFAFGAVFYELLMGSRPFHRGTHLETTRALLNEDPPPPSTVNPAVSAACDAIVAKALEKDRELRYQSAAEIKSDILRARRELTGSGSQPPAPALPSARPPSWLTRLALAFGVLLVGAALVAGGLALLRVRGAVPAFEPTQVTRGLGFDSDPALSPDGDFLAYAAEDGGNQDIWLLDLRSHSAIRRTTDAAPDRHPVWMPSGAELLFVSERDGKPGVWRMPALDGPAVRLIPDADDVAVSPDGRHVAFVRAGPSLEKRVAVAPLSDVNQVRFLTQDGDGIWEHREPAWSPDGLQICYRGQMSLWVVPLSGARPRQILASNHLQLSPSWSRRGHIYYSSNRDGTEAIWRTHLSGGRPQRVTPGTGPEKQPVVSQDGRTLAFATSREDTELVVRRMDTGQEFTWSTSSYESMPSLSPDGRTVFFVLQAQTGSNQIWALRLEAGRPVGKAMQLTGHAGHAMHPACSPDGKWVAYFVIEEAGRRRGIWVVPASGGEATRVTDGPADSNPAWTADGRHLLFMREEKEVNHIWRAPVREGRADGPRVQLTRDTRGDAAPVASPDGSLIAFSRSGETPGNRELWVMGADGRGRGRQVTRGAQVHRVQWEAASGEAVLVSGKWGGRWLEMRRVRLRDGAVTPVLPQGTFGPIDEIPDFSLSGDGQLIAFARFRQQGNIWVGRAVRGGF